MGAEGRMISRVLPLVAYFGNSVALSEDGMTVAGSAISNPDYYCRRWRCLRVRMGWVFVVAEGRADFW